MDDRILELLQSIAITAVRAQKSLENNDHGECWNCIDDIEGDLRHIKDKLDNTNHGE